MRSCGNLGLMYEKGWGVQMDMARAVQLYTRACHAGVAVACRNVGRLSEANGPTPDLDRSNSAYGRALELSTAACERGSGEGCATAEYMYEDGKGVPPDAARGHELVSQACRLGYLWACKPRKKD
jgi:hypothetical protein